MRLRFLLPGLGLLLLLLGACATPNPDRNPDKPVLVRVLSGTVALRFQLSLRNMDRDSAGGRLAWGEEISSEPQTASLKAGEEHQFILSHAMQLSLGLFPANEGGALVELLAGGTTTTVTIQSADILGVYYNFSN